MATKDNEAEAMKDPFRTKGEYDDEITLRFDDGQELYVSSTFLKMSSPVFKTMLDSNFREKETNVVELKEKTLADFLVLLKYLHPALHEPITVDTVLSVLPLAHEYQVESALRDCKKNFPSPNSGQPFVSLLTHLKYADLYGLKKEREQVISVLKIRKTINYNPLRYTDKDAAAFKVLSDNAKIDLLLARLYECDR